MADTPTTGAEAQQQQPEPQREPDPFARALLHNFWQGIGLQLNWEGFCIVGARLVDGLFYDAFGAEPKVDELNALAGKRVSATAMLDRRGGKVVFRKLWPPLEDADSYQRASGDVVCQVCGYVLFDHPTDAGLEFLHVRCDGVWVKL